jgi:hypothetical protein
MSDEPMGEMPVPEAKPPVVEARAPDPPVLKQAQVPTPATGTVDDKEPATPNVVIEHDWLPKDNTVPIGDPADRPTPPDPITLPPADPLKLRSLPRPRNSVVEEAAATPPRPNPNMTRIPNDASFRT